MLQLTPRTSRAARPGSVSRAWLVPANTSISPEVTSRTCTITGPAGLMPPPAGRAGLAAAAAMGVAIAPVMAPAARPAPARPAAPRMTDRRDRPGRCPIAGSSGPGDSLVGCSVDMLIPLSWVADRRHSFVVRGREAPAMQAWPMCPASPGLRGRWAGGRPAGPGRYQSVTFTGVISRPTGDSGDAVGRPPIRLAAGLE